MHRRTIIPYEGTKPYVFVSYAHKDTDLVMPVLERLYAMGYRIWFDDGIAPGSEWPENIARHLNDCTLTMAFVSPNSIASDNCRREVTFALSKRKPFLGVILQETEMSLGMEMQLSAQQCVMKYAYQREEDFISKICTCPELALCYDAQQKQENDMAKATQEKELQRDTEGNQGSGDSIPLTGASKPEKKSRKQREKKQPKGCSKADTKEKRPAVGLKKVVSAVAAVIAAVALIILGYSAMTGVRLTENKKVSTNDVFLSLSGETVTEEMAKQIARMNKLETVSFRDCTFQPGTLAAMDLPEIMREFSATNCSGMEDLTFLQGLTNLTGLTLETCGVSDDALAGITLNSLRRLNLSGNGAVTNLSHFAQYPALTELDVSDTGIKSLKGLETLSLTKLNFSNTAVSDVTLLAGMEALTNIQGSGTAVTDIDALASLEKLNVLNFINCRIREINAPFRSLRLSQLWLENNGLMGLDAFADCTVLKQAWLAGNRLTDVSVLEKSAETLTYLSLSGNELTYENLEFLKDAVNMKELYLDGLSLIDPYLQDLAFVENMTGLEKLSAVGCGLTEIPPLTLENLSWLRLANNRIDTTFALEKLSTTAVLTLDLSYNPIATLQYLPQVRYGVLALYAVDADLDTLPALEGRVLCVSYQDGMESTHLAEKTFGSYNILSCPADKVVETEDLLGAFRIHLLETEADVIAQMKKDGLDYSFLTRMEDEA